MYRLQHTAHFGGVGVHRFFTRITASLAAGIEEGVYTIQYSGQGSCSDMYLSYRKFDKSIPARVVLQSAKAKKPAEWKISNNKDGSITLSAISRASCCPGNLVYDTKKCSSSVWISDQGAMTWNIRHSNQGKESYAMFSRHKLAGNDSVVLSRLGPKAARGSDTRCSRNIALFPSLTMGLSWRFKFIRPAVATVDVVIDIPLVSLDLLFRNQTVDSFDEAKQEQLCAELILASQYDPENVYCKVTEIVEVPGSNRKLHQAPGGVGIVVSTGMVFLPDSSTTVTVTNTVGGTALEPSLPYYPTETNVVTTCTGCAVGVSNLACFFGTVSTDTSGCSTSPATTQGLLVPAGVPIGWSTGGINITVTTTATTTTTTTTTNNLNPVGTVSTGLTSSLGSIINAIIGNTVGTTVGGGLGGGGLGGGGLGGGGIAGGGLGGGGIAGGGLDGGGLLSVCLYPGAPSCEIVSCTWCSATPTCVSGSGCQSIMNTNRSPPIIPNISPAPIPVPSPVQIPVSPDPPLPSPIPVPITPSPPPPSPPPPAQAAPSPPPPAQAAPSPPPPAQAAPSAPSQVTTTSVTGTSATITWVDSITPGYPQETYTVQCMIGGQTTCSSPASSTKNCVPRGTQTATVTNLVSGASYECWVEATNTVGTTCSLSPSTATTTAQLG